MPIPHSPRPGEDTDRIISEYILGTYVLTPEDLADPAATANEIWLGLQEANPDWFEQNGSVNAEDVNITQADLEAYIERQEGERTMPEYYAYTPAKAAEILGVKRSYVYLLLGKLDPKTGGTVLEKFTPPNIAGETRLYITAESVERFKQQRAG